MTAKKKTTKKKNTKRRAPATPIPKIWEAARLPPDKALVSVIIALYPDGSFGVARGEPGCAVDDLMDGAQANVENDMEDGYLDDEITFYRVDMMLDRESTDQRSHAATFSRLVYQRKQTTILVEDE